MSQPIQAQQVPGWTVKVGDTVMVAYRVAQLYDNGIGFLQRHDGSLISIRANEILTQTMVSHAVPPAPIATAPVSPNQPGPVPQPVYVNPEVVR